MHSSGILLHRASFGIVGQTSGGAFRGKPLTFRSQSSTIAVASLSAHRSSMATWPAGVLLTGWPGIGKSTASRKVVELCQQRGACVEGFLTEEIRKPGVGRVGFRLVGLGSAEGQSAPLACTGLDAGSGPRVGKYTVCLSEFEALAIPVLDRALAATQFARGHSEKPLVFVIDEIGKMELFSQDFVIRMRELMRRRPVPLLITVAVGGGGFIAEAKRMHGFELMEISTESRDAAPDQIVAKLMSSSGDTASFTEASPTSRSSITRRWHPRRDAAVVSAPGDVAESGCDDGGPVVVWMRNELRLADNPLLVKALELCSRKPGAERMLAIVICLDPRTFEPAAMTSFGSSKVGSLRRRFVEESIADLEASLRQRGSRLFVCDAAPEEVLPAMVHRCGAQLVLATREFCPEEHSQEALCSERLRSANAKLQLLDPGGITTLFSERDLEQVGVRTGDEFPEDFQGFYQRARNSVPNVARQGLAKAPTKFPPPPILIDPLPGLRTSSSPPSSAPHPAAPPFHGGEVAALERLQEWLKVGGLGRYKAKFRSLMGDYSSRLSPYLALGCLSPHRLVTEVLSTRASVVHVDHFVYELCWRDFFRFTALRWGATLFRLEGPLGFKKPSTSSSGWRRDVEVEDRWKTGRTGIPLVDATMRELVATGYMGNLARQIAAAFLVEQLWIDWRVGADWFEAHLIDYDPHSNWGQWARSAGVVATNESKKSRVGGTRYYDLALALQDGEAIRYIRHWVPELASMPDDRIFAPWAAMQSSSKDEPMATPELRRYFEMVTQSNVASRNTQSGKGKLNRGKGESIGADEGKGRPSGSGGTRRWQASR